MRIQRGAPTKHTLANRMRAYSRTKVRPQWRRRERVRVASASMGVRAPISLNAVSAFFAAVSLRRAWIKLVVLSLASLLY